MRKKCCTLSEVILVNCLRGALDSSAHIRPLNWELATIKCTIANVWCQSQYQKQYVEGNEKRLSWWDLISFNVFVLLIVNNDDCKKVTFHHWPSSHTLFDLSWRVAEIFLLKQLIFKIFQVHAWLLNKVPSLNFYAPSLQVFNILLWCSVWRVWGYKDEEFIDSIESRELSEAVIK